MNNESVYKTEVSPSVLVDCIELFAKGDNVDDIEAIHISRGSNGRFEIVVHKRNNLPEGFALFGCRMVIRPEGYDDISNDIAEFSESKKEWKIGSFGNGFDTRYAIRKGTDLARINLFEGWESITPEEQ